MLEPGTSELDHKDPRAKHGGDNIGNLQWLCIQCNRAKGTLDMNSFVDMCHRIAANVTPCHAICQTGSAE